MATSNSGNSGFGGFLWMIFVVIAIKVALKVITAASLANMH